MDDPNDIVHTLWLLKMEVIRFYSAHGHDKAAPSPRRKWYFVLDQMLVQLWNRFSWPRFSFLAVETGSRPGTGSELVLEPAWRG